MYNINSVHVNPFVLRQTASSPYSHSSLPMQEVANLLSEVPSENISEGYRPASYEQGGRVILARLTPEQTGDLFYSAITLVKEGEEVIEGFRSRVEGETPRAYREVVRSEKPVAKTVDLVFYNSIALAQDGNNVSEPQEGNWELISINASEDDNMEAPPITPTALEANYKGLDGGTLTSMSEEEYQEKMKISKAYWGIRANIRLEE